MMKRMLSPDEYREWVVLKIKENLLLRMIRKTGDMKEIKTIASLLGVTNRTVLRELAHIRYKIVRYYERKGDTTIVDLLRHVEEVNDDTREVVEDYVNDITWREGCGW